MHAGLRNNDMGCLSNTVYQACIKSNLIISQAILSEMRAMVESATIALDAIDGVTLHQCPKRNGYVTYRLDVHATIDKECEVLTKEFQGSSLTAKHMDFILYNKERDGKVMFLHLKH